MFERADFRSAAVFTGAKFASHAWFPAAQFIRTTFDDVCGLPRARFGGDTIFDHVRFGGPVGFVGADFAQPLRIETVWVRLDGRKLDVDSTWPPGTVGTVALSQRTPSSRFKPAKQAPQSCGEP